MNKMLLSSLLFVAMSATAGQEWCRTSDGYCFTTWDGYKVSQVPGAWKPHEIHSISSASAQAPGAVPPVPPECLDDGRPLGWIPPEHCPCAGLVIGPDTCEE